MKPADDDDRPILRRAHALRREPVPIHPNSCQSPCKGTTEASRTIKWVAILLALALFACGDDASTVSDTGASDGGDAGQGDGDVANGGLTTTPATGLLTVFGTQSPLEGAEVCVMDAEPPVCTTSDVNGEFELEVPVHSEVALTITAEGFQSTILVFTTTLVGFNATGVPMAARTTTESLLGSIDLTQSPDKGLVIITAPFSGMTPVIEPASGDEPFYLAGVNITHSETGSPVDGGYAGITNVEPGTVTFHLDHATATCVYLGWGTEANEVQLPIRAGFLTAPFQPECE